MQVFRFERSGLSSEGETALEVKVQRGKRKSRVGLVVRHMWVDDKLKLIAQEVLVINRSLIKNIVRGKIFLLFSYLKVFKLR